MEISSELISFISKKGKVRKEELNLDTEIFNSSIISSLTLLELMVYIENKFNISIDADALIIDNFRNIRTIADYIEKQLSFNSQCA